MIFYKVNDLAGVVFNMDSMQHHIKNEWWVIVDHVVPDYLKYVEKLELQIWYAEQKYRKYREQNALIGYISVKRFLKDMELYDCYLGKDY